MEEGILYTQKEINIMVVENHIRLCALEKFAFYLFSEVEKLNDPELANLDARIPLIKAFSAALGECQRRCVESDPKISEHLRDRLLNDLEGLLPEL